jgi:dolichol-phosphate mannosyltransferase
MTCKKLIIIATYNERDNITPIINEIMSQNSGADVLVIDDNSPDQTYLIVEELSQIYTNLFLMKRKGKMGLGSAYVAGFHWALDKGYDYIMHMDADFSHNPKYINTIFSYMDRYDLVLGSRYTKGGSVVNWSLSRKCISRGGNIYAQIMLNMPFYDLTGGFKCFKAEVLRNIGIDTLMAKGYGFQIETTFRAYLSGFKILELPIAFEDRRVGQSKMSGNIFSEAMLMVLKLRLMKKYLIAQQKV